MSRTQLRQKHQTIVGLGGDGFRAQCTCGWASSTNKDRAIVAQAAGGHKILATDRLGPCPACRTKLDPTVPLRCKHCGWHLMTLDAWEKLSPHAQGYALYLQGNWPTSELFNAKNPHKEGSSAWEEFQQGEQRAAMDTQDGEE
jgi:hypothetical protein